MRRGAVVLVIACAAGVIWLAWSLRAGPLHVVVTEGKLATYANDRDGEAVGYGDAAGFADDARRRAAVDSRDEVWAESRGVYRWTNAGGQAVFEARAPHLQVVGPGHFAYVIQQFTFTLEQPVDYSLEGAIEGIADDDEDFAILNVVLRNADTGVTIGEELNSARRKSFRLQIAGEQQGNRQFFRQGALSGQLEPGTYQFVGQVQVQREADAANHIFASGFTRLTLRGR